MVSVMDCAASTTFCNFLPLVANQTMMQPDCTLYDASIQVSKSLVLVFMINYRLNVITI